MEKIRWSDEFSVGVEQLDNQHKKLVNIVNLLIENKSLGSRSEFVANSLKDMVDYSVEHFKQEENLLKQANCPYLEEQKECHRNYNLKLAEFYKEVISRNDRITLEIIVYLKKWWIHHILDEDKKYKKYL